MKGGNLVNKGELITAICEKTDIPKKTTEEFLNAFISIISEELKKGEKIQLVGFGSFEVKKIASRKGHNPQTGEEIKIPAYQKPVFKAGKKLKNIINT